MTILDEMADAYLAGLEIPAGPGPENIMARARRRRFAKIAATTLVAAVFVGLGIAGWTSRESSSTARTADTTPVDRPAPGDEAAWESIDMANDFAGFPLVDPATIPVQLAPVEGELPDGWNLTIISVDHTDELGAAVRYRIDTAEAQSVELMIDNGQSSLVDHTPLTLQRGGQPIDAAVFGSGTNISVRWNEIPGVNDGTTMGLSGSDLDLLVEVAEMLSFEPTQVRGAEDPDISDLPDGLQTHLAGLVDSHSWRVLVDPNTIALQLVRNPYQGIAVEVNGIEPQATHGSAHQGPVDLEIHMTTYNGARVIALLAPVDITRIQAVSPGTSPVSLPMRPIEGTDLAVAVAALPATVASPDIRVTTPDGDQFQLKIGTAPTTGWSTETRTINAN